MESGLRDRFRHQLEYAMNDLSASYQLDIIWLRDRYRKYGALYSREYAVALIVLLDEITASSWRSLAPKLREIAREIPSDQLAWWTEDITGRYEQCLFSLSSTVISDELHEYGLTTNLDDVIDGLVDDIRRSVRGWLGEQSGLHRGRSAEADHTVE